MSLESDAKKLSPERVAELLGVVRAIAQGFKDEGYVDSSDAEQCENLVSEIEEDLNH